MGDVIFSNPDETKDYLILNNFHRNLVFIKLIKSELNVKVAFKTLNRMKLIPCYFLKAANVFCIQHCLIYTLQETDNIFVFLVGKIYMFNDCLRAISDLSDHCDTY